MKLSTKLEKDGGRGIEATGVVLEGTALPLGRDAVGPGSGDRDL